MLVAVVGISGVGKEYIRELEDFEVPYILVDFKEVLDREVTQRISGGWAVENVYPGHSFEVNLTDWFRGTALADIEASALLQQFWAKGVTHVVHATPPITGRELFDLSMVRGDEAKHLVEKPFWSTWSRGDVSVGYLYRHLNIQAQQSVRVRAPLSPGWRSMMGQNPLLWDLGGHALSVIDANWWEDLHVLSENPEHIQLAGPVTVDLRYMPSTSVMLADDDAVDWNEAFHRQMQAFLQNEEHEAYSVYAMALERELWRLEGEINVIRFAGSTATE